MLNLTAYNVVSLIESEIEHYPIADIVLEHIKEREGKRFDKRVTGAILQAVEALPGMERAWITGSDQFGGKRIGVWAQEKGKRVVEHIFELGPGPITCDSDVFARRNARYFAAKDERNKERARLLGQSPGDLSVAARLAATLNELNEAASRLASLVDECDSPVGNLTYGAITALLDKDAINRIPGIKAR